MDFNEFKKILTDKFFKIIGIELSDDKCQKFFDFMNLLVERNKVMNLTAIEDPEEIIVRHFVDSSILFKIFGEEFFIDKKVIDVGTGAGFPGLPLAIICDKCHFVLTDTLGKRIKFLEDVKDSINIPNVELVKSRAEDLGNNSKFRETFDYATSRAVSNLSTLSEYCLPFVKVGGKMIAYKMDDCNVELEEAESAVKTLGGMFHVKHTYELMSSEPKRCIVDIDKVKATPKSYPRKAGIPSKEPIGANN